MMGGMNDLVAFLRARLDEDAAAANLMAQFYPPPWEASDRGWMARVMADGPNFWEVIRLEQWAAQPTGEDAPYLGDIIDHIARHDPARVLAEVAIDRELLRNYERLLRAHEQHKAAVAELDADIDHEARTGRWEGTGLPDVRQQSLRREADYLPAQVHTLEGWAKGKASVYADHPDYREQWRP